MEQFFVEHVELIFFLAGLAIVGMVQWRRENPAVLRRMNQDLRERNEQLEGENRSLEVAVGKLETKVQALEDELKILRAKDTEKLYDIMVAHDRTTGDLQTRIDSNLSLLLEAVNQLNITVAGLSEGVRIAIAAAMTDKA